MSLSIPQIEYFEGGTVNISVLIERSISLRREIDVNLTLELGKSYEDTASEKYTIVL